MTSFTPARSLSSGIVTALRGLWAFFAPRPAGAAVRAQLWPAAVSALAFCVSCVVFGPELGAVGMLGALVPFWETGRPLWRRVRAGAVITASACLCMSVGILVSPVPWAALPVCVLSVLVIGLVYQVLMPLDGPSPAMMFYAVAIGSYFGSVPGIGWAMVPVTAVTAGLASLMLLVPLLVRPGRFADASVGAAAAAVAAFADDPVRERRHAAADALARAGERVGRRGEHRSRLERAAGVFVVGLGDADEPRPVPPRASWRHRLRRALRPQSLEWFLTWRMALAAALAGAASLLAGTGHPYWAVLAATIILSTWIDPRASLLRAARRTVGTILGVLLTELVLSLHPSAAVLVVCIVLSIVGMYLLIPVNYALALVVITPMALLANAVSGAWSETAASDRILDTCFAAVAACVVMWLSAGRAGHRVLRRQSRRLVAATEAASAGDDGAAGVLLAELRHHHDVMSRARQSTGTSVEPAWLDEEHRRSDDGYRALARAWPRV